MKPILTLLAIPAFLCGHSHAARLKTFILAEQSNMKGHAKIETLDCIDNDGRLRVCDHKFADISPALILTPPQGLEIGYRPIVIRQEIDQP